MIIMTRQERGNEQLTGNKFTPADQAQQNGSKYHLWIDE